MKVTKPQIIIHAFALTHAVVSLACKLGGIADDLLLTLLTMLMILILCLQHKLDELFMTVAVLTVNIVGFALGSGLASLLSLLPISAIVVHPLSTCLITELLGWSCIACAQAYRRRRKTESRLGTRSLRIILLAFVVILLLRLSLILFKSDISNPDSFRIEILVDYIFSCLALLLLAEYAIRERTRADKARQEANLSHYRYLTFKQQVKPHFLFNTLNVLDGLIQEGKNEEASIFTRKFADIYRYILKFEEGNTVALEDELRFVGDYCDLLKVRFGSSLTIRTDIADSCRQAMIVPCALQLLIENAIKHNSVSSTSPLQISITATEDTITVSNVKQPKISTEAGSGLGLKYLTKQYKDLSSRPVIIDQNDKNFIITLPLL